MKERRQLPSIPDARNRKSSMQKTAKGSQLSGEKKTRKRLPVSSVNGSERGSYRTRTKIKKMMVAIPWNSQDSRHSSA